MPWVRRYLENEWDSMTIVTPQDCHSTRSLLLGMAAFSPSSLISCRLQTVEKEYLALVAGEITKKAFTVEGRIAQHPDREYDSLTLSVLEALRLLPSLLLHDCGHSYG